MWKLEGDLTTPSKSFENIWTSLSLTTVINTTTLDTNTNPTLADHLLDVDENNRVEEGRIDVNVGTNLASTQRNMLSYEPCHRNAELFPC